MNSFKLAIAGLLLAPFLLFGQGSTGSILGTVTDPTGAVIPGSQVTITNVDTGIANEVTTNEVGNYVVRFLQPGRYSVQGAAEGFSRVLRENIVLEMTREQRVDLQLSPGQVTEVVEVTAAPPLLETETGQQSTTIENKLMVSLPLLGRNPQLLMRLAPGVVQRGGSTITSGGVVRKDPYFLDGAHSSSHVWSGNPVNPNPDVLQEFKAITNSFSAEYGETSGAIMSATTKSGTNQFHGVLWEFLRNDKLNAGNFFSHQRPVLRRNEFGGTIGGPIVKDKTFFFLALSLQRIKGSAAFTNLTVPIDPFRNGDFSSLLGSQIGTDASGNPVFGRQIFDPSTTRDAGDTVVRDSFANNTIPVSRISPAAATMTGLFPQPQTADPFRNFNAFGSTGDNSIEWNLKIDHHFSNSDKVMTRLSAVRGKSERPCAFPEPGGGGALGECAPSLTNARYQIVANHVHTFSARAVNSFQVSWFNVYPKRTVAGYGSVSTNSLGIFGLPDGADPKGTPTVDFQNFRNLGSSGDTLFFELQNSYGLVNTTSMVFNSHTIKFGGEARKVRTDNLQPNPGNTRWGFQNTFTDQRGFSGSGFDYASFLLGLPTSLSYRIFPGFFGSRASIYGLFLQDDWRVNDKLTLNIGMRWDAPTYYHEVKDRSGVFDLEQRRIQQYGQDGFRRTPWKNDWLNFGPRFGLAYRATPSTVIRAGYGLFTIGTMSSGAFGFLQPEPIFADADVGRYNTIDQINPRTTLDQIPYAPADKTGSNSNSVTVYPDNNAMSYMQQWNLNVQRQVGKVMFEVGYAGSKGTHLGYGGYNLNAIPLDQAAEARGQRIAPYVLFPEYPSGVNINTWIGDSVYHALQIKAERRYSSGLGFLFAYTWQKTISRGDEGYRDPLNNRNVDRGVEQNSVPQRISLGFNYDLPFGQGRPWVQSGPASWFIGGWQLSGILTMQGGFPMNPGLAQDSCVCGSTGRPNVVGDPVLDGSQQSLDRWFNVEAFAQPQLYTVGDAGRGLFYGPALRGLDLNIAKRFEVTALKEGAAFEVRGELYNITNSPQYSNPNISIGSANAGRITSVGGSREVQLALKFYW